MEKVFKKKNSGGEILVDQKPPFGNKRVAVLAKLVNLKRQQEKNQPFFYFIFLFFILFFFLVSGPIQAKSGLFVYLLISSLGKIMARRTYAGNKVLPHL